MSRTFPPLVEAFATIRDGTGWYNALVVYTRGARYARAVVLLDPPKGYRTGSRPPGSLVQVEIDGGDADWTVLE